MKQALRQPTCSIMKALSGQQIVLAKPPNKVRLVIGLARRAAIHAAERGKHGVIKPRPHAEAEHRPGREIDRQRRRKADAGQAGGIAERTRQQHRPPAVFVDDAADLRRDQPRDQ